MFKQAKLNKRFWLHYGTYSHGVHLGLVIDRYGFDVSLLFIYIGMEW